MINVLVAKHICMVLLKRHADSSYLVKKGNSRRDQRSSSVRLYTRHDYAGLINAPKAYGRKRNLYKNLQRVCGISRGFLFFLSLPFGERKSERAWRDRAHYEALALYRAPLCARRTPSERLRLVSKSHLTLTWGGVMNQHDLRFARPVFLPYWNQCRSSAQSPTIPSRILVLS